VKDSPNTRVFSERQGSPTKPQRILITGALGRVAAAVIPSLGKKYELCLTDKFPAQETALDYRQADLIDFDQIFATMEGMDAVVHCAIASERHFGGKTIDGKKSPEYEAAMLDVNIRGTYNVFEAARRKGVKKIIYISSLTVYFGDKSRPSFDATSSLAPQNLYACTKLFGENLGEVYHRNHGISVITLRIGQPYPVGVDYLDNGWRESKRKRYSYITMEDVAQVIICALEAPVSYGVYNVSSASDNQRVDLEPIGKIGYVPCGYFSGKGLEFFEDGKFPPPDGC